ncbi:MAG: rhodanese-like domain-containing protein [Verrucomicrobiota bacterium]
MNKEISATDAAKMREETPETVLLDVREPEEVAFCSIKGSLHIPMGEIPGRVDSLPTTAPLVVFCHHGMRSMNVLQYLESRGFKNVINMAGGIHAWSHEVDPEVPSY